MKRTLITLVCLVAMFASGTGLTAQETSIILSPGWTWISYPNEEMMEVSSAFASFVPMNGDQIRSQFSTTIYLNGRWRGSLTHFIPGLGYQYFSSRTEEIELIFAQPASNVVTTGEPTDITLSSAVVGGTVMLPENSQVFMRGVCWGTAPSPDIDGDHTTEETGIGGFSSTLEGLTPNTTYYVRAYVVYDHGLAYGNVLNFTTESGGGGTDHDYVDLGLPSGTLWATCNVGANNPEDYGDYFAWGETQPKDIYDWSTYQHCNGTEQTLTKYCNNENYGYNGFTDDLTTLLPEDDAATANWGSDWHMPTKLEWKELLDNTTNIWTTQNGVNGRLFTASNGNSIFLPAAGYSGGSSQGSVGVCGNYQSSSLGAGIPSNVWILSFVSTDCSMGINRRRLGQSVRPVRSSGQNTSFIINAIANPMEGGIVTGGGTYLEGQSCTVTATANEGYTFTNWTENDEVVSTDATYSFSVETDRALVANFAVSSGGDHDYVDLGLPSGRLWATCNVGADNPEDYGDYFAWGETTPKDTYDWTTYQYCNGTSGTLTKYCSKSNYGYNGFTDNLTILSPEDDAASANWGSDWRMPTDVEWQELYNNTTVTRTTWNGVNGLLFTASNGNSLFMPTTGYHGNNSLNQAGSNGYYWSRSLDTDYPNGAKYFRIGSDSYYMYFLDRFYGLSVRPVRVESQNTVLTGAINGKFTINNSGDQVYFSRGNLQYIGSASTPYWKFADNQWDFLYTFTGQNSNDQIVDRDLFGWGTSGYDHGAVCYQPWSTSTNDSDYYSYGNSTYNLYDQTGQADWGYNPISNGGNQENLWRTLTKQEWLYVFNRRNTTSGILYAKANVNNVDGVILLPDDWSASIYNLSNTNSAEASFTSNLITTWQWIGLEQHGAVFLPAASKRTGTSIVIVGEGCYWSSSYDSSFAANGLDFFDSDLRANYNDSRKNGRSVRLVTPAEN